MKIHILSRAARWMVISLCLVLALPVASAGDLRPDVKTAIDKGLKWLRTQQQDDGSWEHYPGITSLTVLAYLRSPRRYGPDDGPFIRRPLDYLAGLAQPDGGIYASDLPAYNTAVALLALTASKDPKYHEVITNARRFLVGLQADESEGYSPGDRFYGGIGYGNDERPDLSNLQLALEALKESGLAADDPAFSKAITFIQRCQNRSESNDQAWASNDGGFIYYPGHEMTHSYGSMTYAGLKSFLHASVDRDDPRVKAAVSWVRNHYTVDENPGMGQHGLFYYYFTFAKALAILGQQKIADSNGVEHDWYEDLARKILAMQKDDGYWVNEKSERWWEGNKVLATSYAILALEAGY